MKRNNPSTSDEAYRSLDVKQMTEIYKQIIQSLGVIGEGSFEDIASHMHVEKSRVWRRMNELEKMGVVYRPGNKRVLKSGRQGFTWMLCNSATPKTENPNRYRKGVPNAVDYANKIIETAKNYGTVQRELF